MTLVMTVIYDRLIRPGSFFTTQFKVYATNRAAMVLLVKHS